MRLQDRWLAFERNGFQRLKHGHRYLPCLPLIDQSFRKLEY